MAKKQELFEDSKREALSHFKTAVKTLADIEHPSHIKDAMEYFVTGIRFVDSAEEHAPSTREALEMQRLKSDAVDDMSTAITDLLKSATVRFGKKQKLVF